MSRDTPLLLVVEADPPDPDAVVARCRAFVQTVPSGTEALIVIILRAAPAGLAEWPAHAAAAGLGAFIRAAALDWAPRGIRVNGIERGHAASTDQLAAMVRAMRRWPSMTGQTVRLGA